MRFLLLLLVLPILVLFGAPALAFNPYANLMPQSLWTLGFIAVGGLALGGAIVNKEFHFKEHFRDMLPWMLVVLVLAFIVSVR